MTSKMAVRILFYAKGSPGYGDSKGTKLKIIAKKIVLPSLRLVYVNWVFFNSQKMVSFSAGTNGE